jgi:hypothetical protein
MELCSVGLDGFVKDSAPTFKVMADELSNTKILICPQDRLTKPAPNFASLSATNISYRLRSGPDITDANPTNILALCSVCGNILRCDGSVTVVTDDRGSPNGSLSDLLRYNERVRFSVFRAALVVALGTILLWLGIAFRWNTNRVGGGSEFVAAEVTKRRAAKQEIKQWRADPSPGVFGEIRLLTSAATL